MNGELDAPLTEILHPGLLDGDGNLVVSVHRALRTAIVQARLLPNRTLSEKEIAACLDTSKTPVREALIRLTDERLVAVVPKSGTRVSPIDIERFRVGCFARLHLETAAVREAAKLRTDEQMIALTANLSLQREAVTAESYWELHLHDEQFHNMILRMAGLASLIPVLETAKVEVDRIRSLKSHLGIRRTEIVLRQHQQILEAIAERDAGRAYAEVYAHLGEVDKRIWELGADSQLWNYIETVNNRRGKPAIAGFG